VRIGIVLQDPRRPATGLDAYTANLWRALEASESGHEFVPVTLPTWVAGRSYLRTLWEQAYLPAWARRARLDLVHVPAGSAPVIRGVPCLLTLHDLGDPPDATYRTPLGSRLYFRKVVPWSARFASAIVTDSEATKRQAVERLGIPPGRISVVPLAPAPVFRRLRDEAVRAVRQKYALADEYFLQVGSGIPRKNVAGCVSGFVRFVGQTGDRETQLVLAGGAPALPDAGLLVAAGRLRVLGHVPQEDLVALYNGALAVLLPSFYEGFGLPLVEGFACGTPAIAANVTSLPEVGGDAALYIDPHVPSAIADAMARIAGSPELRALLASRALARSRAFSWEKTVGETLAVYQRAVAERASAAGAPAKERGAS
jgi:glycosyltransferase involved in cell wall biosynthesis